MKCIIWKTFYRNACETTDKMDDIQYQSFILAVNELTHWGIDKMVTILQTAISKAFS